MGSRWVLMGTHRGISTAAQCGLMLTRSRPASDGRRGSRPVFKGGDGAAHCSGSHVITCLGSLISPSAAHLERIGGEVCVVGGRARWHGRFPPGYGGRHAASQEPTRGGCSTAAQCAFMVAARWCGASDSRGFMVLTWSLMPPPLASGGIANGYGVDAHVIFRNREPARAQLTIRGRQRMVTARGRQRSPPPSAIHICTMLSGVDALAGQNTESGGGSLAGPCIVAVGSESVVLTLGSVVLCVLCGISRGSGFVEL